MDKVAKVAELLKTLIKQCYTGNVTLHFNKGSLCKVEKKETLAI